MNVSTLKYVLTVTNLTDNLLIIWLDNQKINSSSAKKKKGITLIYTEI